MLRLIATFGFGTVLVVVDQLAKNFFIKHPGYYQDVFATLSFHFVKNTGIAFGIGINQILLFSLILIILIMVLRWYISAYYKKEIIRMIANSMIIAGAISNLIDRVNYGFVVDYIDVSWFSVFNIADSAIAVGVALLILEEFFTKKKINLEKKSSEG